MREAKKGKGRVSPNPLVGAVVVKGGALVATGHHAGPGTDHAEAAVLKKAKHANGATLYITLEPCAHVGATPPCAKGIAVAGIARVVIGQSKDPDLRVSGKGVAYLRNKKIRVTAGVLGKECAAMNGFYNTAKTKKRPWVTIKIAQTLDGKIADAKNKSQWISAPASRAFAHQLRAEYDAILAGRKTVTIDNPRLTTRLAKGKDPVRVILDPRLRVSPKARVFSTPGTLVYYAQATKKKHDVLEKAGAICVRVPAKGKRMALRHVLADLTKRGVQSLLVEGGAATWANFIVSRLVDEAVVVVAPKILGQGKDAFEALPSFGLDDALQLENVRVTKKDVDTVIRGQIR